MWIPFVEEPPHIDSLFGWGLHALILFVEEPPHIDSLCGGVQSHCIAIALYCIAIALHCVAIALRCIALDCIASSSLSPLSLGETEEEGGGQTPRALFYFPHSYPFSILRLGATEEEGRERMWAIPLASHISYIIPLGLAEREEEGRG